MALADTVQDRAHSYPSRDGLNGLTGKLHTAVISPANTAPKIAMNSAQSRVSAHEQRIIFALITSIWEYLSIPGNPFIQIQA